MSPAIPVILSGGSGTRLWPVSRSALPKPFMRLGDGATLLERTARRALAALPDAPALYTVTAAGQQFLTRDVYDALLPATVRSQLLLEPSARNTAPAVLMAALAARDAFGADAELLILAADHLIDDDAAFAGAVARARALARGGELVTFGIVPTRAETGYGYIEQGAALGDDAARVARFVEKPDRARAEAYLAGGRHLWNSGMFVFTAGHLLDAARQVCADVLDACRAAWVAIPRTNADAIIFDAERYAAIPSISIDYAIMERAANVAVVVARFGWSDVGTWREIAEQYPADARGNRAHGDAIVVDSDQSFVHAASRTVVALGLRDIAIVETADAVLVAHRDAAQEVKRVVDALKARGSSTVEHHLSVDRPWGRYTVLEDASDCKVKRLTVKPGGVLSLQYHHRRSEHWTVVTGTATVRIGELTRDVPAGESVFIPQGTLHRLENRTDRDLHLIEVQVGAYFGEDDIVRLEDRYGRAPAKT